MAMDMGGPVTLTPEERVMFDNIRKRTVPWKLTEEPTKFPFPTAAFNGKYDASIMQGIGEDELLEAVEETLQGRARTHYATGDRVLRTVLCPESEPLGPRSLLEVRLLSGGSDISVVKDRIERLPVVSYLGFGPVLPASAYGLD